MITSNIYEELSNFYHKKTFSSKWKLNCGSGNTKLDEIQIFLKYLDNKKEEIKNVEEFDSNFLYKEKDVIEPGDVEYKKQSYQITHGNINSYSEFMRIKSKSEKVSFIIPYVVEDIKKSTLKIINQKEKMADSKTILLVMLDRKEFKKELYFEDVELKTRWKNIVFVFNDSNLKIF